MRGSGHGSGSFRTGEWALRGAVFELLWRGPVVALAAPHSSHLVILHLQLGIWCVSGSSSALQLEISSAAPQHAIHRPCLTTVLMRNKSLPMSIIRWMLPKLPSALSPACSPSLSVSYVSDQIRSADPVQTDRRTCRKQVGTLARHGTVCDAYWTKPRITDTDTGRHVRTCQRNPTQHIGDGRPPNKAA
ncbi:hypothetical protein CORC01_07027 [Colletotrichum orchidophilum]|uniref:Uncharacterized protein n=1 Tax=Colletotrichum orchidophilum TaxID=1209926 RepID=A0A1G4B8M1_9PEZI|nr:uncharacterized protein CORC01_07027 [Colletotrichum orchidophilum]OHE97612.1 hypothetical protein CORC01_07027 [Colletotrichum orchidophilum]